jgi:hypothetical protein
MDRVGNSHGGEDALDLAAVDVEFSGYGALAASPTP